MMKATPSATKPDRCAYCGQLIYRTQTARGTEMAHVDSKVLFCTADPVSAAWQATLQFLVEDCGLDAAGTETLIRLAASVADEHSNPTPAPQRISSDTYREALCSFSEPSAVDELATSVATRLYPDRQRA